MLADIFHNLPLLLDSNDFNKEEFWQQIGSYERQFLVNTAHLVNRSAFLLNKISLLRRKRGD